VQRRENVLWRSAPGFLVLAHADGELVAFSGPAAEVWSLLAEPTSPATIAEVLAARYGADVAEVLRDLVPLFEALVARGCVVDDG
jgi:hypothetical protein